MSTSAFIIEELSPMDRRAGRRWKIWAPSGWQFAGGEHSRICATRREADREAREDNVFPCPRGCDCGESFK